MALLETLEEYFPDGDARNTEGTFPGTVGRNIAVVTSFMGQAVPAQMVARVAGPGFMNVVGGTSEEPIEAQRRLFEFVSQISGGDPDTPFDFLASLGSGGTTVIKGDSSEEFPTGIMTAVEAPGIFFRNGRKRRPHDESSWIKTMGHIPRVAKATGYGGRHSSYAISEDVKKAIPNAKIQVLWEILKTVDLPADWDTDVPEYIKLMLLLQASDPTGDTLAGQLVLGGGGVSALEIRLALEAAINVCVVNGTGRVADWVRKLVQKRTLKHIPKDQTRVRAEFAKILDGPPVLLRYITVTEYDNPRDTMQWFVDMGFGHFGR